MTADPRRAWLLALLGFLLCACGGPRSRLLADVDATGAVADALTLIAELPDWDRTLTRDADAWFTADDVQAYVEAARALRAMDPADVRAAYRLYVDWAAEQPTDSPGHPTHVLFVLDRVLFAIPARVPWGEQRYFADVGKDFTSLISPPAEAALLHPVILDESGAVTTIRPAWDTSRRPSGGYDAVKAFDHYRATYGFRDPIRHADAPAP